MNNLNSFVNQPVDVTGFYFANKARKSFPSRIESAGQVLAVFENGLQCLVGHGKNAIQIFTMNDGNNQYNLRFEPAANSWTLLSTHSL
jgi:hypothetical protein